MLEDVVVDTNVLMHAEDGRQTKYQRSCAALIEQLRDATTKLCIDEGYHFEEAKNKSRITAEYLNRLKPGSIGFALVQFLASSDRLKQVSGKVTPSVAKIINQAVTDPPDRVYVKVAHNSQNKILVSHDFGDISAKSRHRLKREIAVEVLTSLAAVLLV